MERACYYLAVHVSTFVTNGCNGQNAASLSQEHREGG